MIAGEDPSTQLRRLRDCLEQARKVQTGVESDVQRFDTQVKELTKFVDEFEKIVKGYDEKQRTLWDDQNCYANLQANEKARLFKELGGQVVVDQIEAAVSSIRREIEDLGGTPTTKGKIKEEEEKLEGTKATEGLREKLSKAVTARDDAAKIFEKAKKPVAWIGERHALLKGLSKQIEDACKAGELAYAYWLLTDNSKYPKLLSDPLQVLETYPKPKPSAASAPQAMASQTTASQTTAPQIAELPDFYTYLLNAWNAYNKAIRGAQDAEGAVKASEEAIKTMKARLKEATDKFEARVKAALSLVKSAKARQL